MTDRLLSPQDAPPAVRRLHIVPHTHWDREWYRTFEAYRHRLVKTLDRVLASELPYFLLDGQTIVLDDYLALRPEAATSLRARIGEGRLGVGPWYVLVDEFLVSGESLVRNLLLGRHMMNAVGATGAVGYLPDMFGHIAQMPQILSQFGLDTAVVWRGAVPDAPRFRWQSPDGSSVTAAWLPLGYYQTMLLEDLADDARRTALETYLAAFGASETVWLLSGADHMAPRLDLPQQLAAMGSAMPGVSFHISPLAQALAGAEPTAELIGELRTPARMAYLLPGVLSTRVGLKQANAACERTLERFVEPLAALAWWQGASFPTSSIDHAWKTLLQNHPHDSICGCSIDEVHRDMAPRFEAVRQVATELLADAVQRTPRPVAEPTLVLFNGTGWAHEGWVELSVEWPMPADTAGETPQSLRLVGPDGADLPVVLREVEDTQVFCAEIDFNPDWFPVRRFHLGARVAVPPMGVLHLRAVAGLAMDVQGQVRVDESGLENAQLAFRRDGDGWTLTDKVTGRTFKDCHAFVDEADAGDSYNFSPLAGDALRHATLVECRLLVSEPHVATLEAHYRLELPEGLTADRSARDATLVRCDAVSRFTLRAESRVVEVETEIDNRARDHRLRWLVGWDGGARPRVLSAGTFGLFERPQVATSELPAAKGTEAVMPEFPQSGYSVMLGEGAALGVVADGLYEASVVEREHGWALATTLIRSVGWLSRDDLRTRGGGAGPRFETPEAQCLGRQVFRHALVPLGDDWTPLMRQAEQFLVPPRVWTGSGPGFDGAVVELGNPAVVLSALKRSAAGDRLVVRAYNPTQAAQSGLLRVGVSHARVLSSTMDEAPGPSLGRGDVPYVLGPYEVRTWLVQR